MPAERNSYEDLDIAGRERSDPLGDTCEDVGMGECPWWPICATTDGIRYDIEAQARIDALLEALRSWT